MADQQTMWSKTLLEGFLSGMKGNPSDAWIKEQIKELEERGMSPDYLSKVLRQDVSESAANRFMEAAGITGGSRRPVRKKVKKSGGLFSRIFSK